MRFGEESRKEFIARRIAECIESKKITKEALADGLAQRTKGDEQTAEISRATARDFVSNTAYALDRLAFGDANKRPDYLTRFVKLFQMIDATDDLVRAMRDYASSLHLPFTYPPAQEGSR